MMPWGAHVGMGCVVVFLDMADVDRLGNPGLLVDITEVGPEVLILVDVLHVTHEVCMVDVIEPNEGRKHADVGLGQLVASEEPLVFEDRIPVVEGVEQFVDGLVVGALFGRESGPVDPLLIGS